LFLVDSPSSPRWAFFIFFSVPLLIFKQCSTVLISPGEQLDQPYSLKDNFVILFLGVLPPLKKVSLRQTRDGSKLGHSQIQFENLILSRDWR
jgi:hypothetical protein